MSHRQRCKGLAAAAGEENLQKGWVVGWLVATSRPPAGRQADPTSPSCPAGMRCTAGARWCSASMCRQPPWTTTRPRTCSRYKAGGAASHSPVGWSAGSSWAAAAGWLAWCRDARSAPTATCISQPCCSAPACHSHHTQYAAVATQIGTIQQAEAPRRTIKAVSPAIKKVKRKAALPPEARRGQGGPNR